MGNKGGNPKEKTGGRQWQTTSVTCQDKASMGTQQEEKAMVLNGEPLRPEGTVKATEEERRLLTSKTSLSRVYDGPGPKPSGRPGADIPSSESCSMSYDASRTVGEKTQEIKIGTWNVRTMNVKGKLENAKQEMKRNNLNVLGISEVRWTEEGDFESDGYRIIYSGGRER